MSDRTIRRTPAACALALAVGLAGLCVLLGAQVPTAEAAPPQMRGVQLIEAWPDVEFQKPVDIGHAGDGTDWMYVAERPGRMMRIQKYRGVGEVPQPKVFLDLRSTVYDKSQGGLLSFTFHPQFRSNRLFYVSYVAQNPTPGPRGLKFKLVVAEYRSQGATADPRSRRIVIEIPKQNASHGAGCIRFSPTDGMLYLSIGDGNVPGADKMPKHPSQNAASYMGKILRIDPMCRAPGKGYAIPEGNPWPTARGVKPEIWSYGWRNPWRFDWDDAGRMWAVEPGSTGPQSREWVQQVVYAGNAGWPFFEGKKANPGSPRGKFIPAAFEYIRGTKGSTAGVGGVFYRGDRVKSLKGSLIFGDFMRGEVYALELSGDGASARGSNFRKIGDVPDVGGFGVDAQGEVYALSSGDLGIVFTLTTEP